VFDLGDLFSQFFANGRGRVRVDHEQDEPRGRRVRQRDIEDAEFERQVRASDGTYLQVKGTNVYSDVRIPFDRAILGTVATVATATARPR